MLRIQKAVVFSPSSGGQELIVAYVGSAPHVSIYEPGLKIAKDDNMPFDLFTNIAEAYKWLGIQPAYQVAGESANLNR